MRDWNEHVMMHRVHSVGTVKHSEGALDIAQEKEHAAAKYARMEKAESKRKEMQVTEDMCFQTL